MIGGVLWGTAAAADGADGSGAVVEADGERAVRAGDDAPLAGGRGRETGPCDEAVPVAVGDEPVAGSSVFVATCSSEPFAASERRVSA